MKLIGLTSFTMLAWMPSFCGGHHDGHDQYDDSIHHADISHHKNTSIIENHTNYDGEVRTVVVEALDSMKFKPDRISVRKGETVKFIIKNTGKLPHEFIIGHMDDLKNHAEEMKKGHHGKHDEPNQVMLQAGEEKEIVWTFKNDGELDFACMLPGHFELGMHGKFEMSH